MAESINKRKDKKPKKMTTEEKSKYLLDSLDYSIWSFIAADCKLWSAEEEFTKIVTKHSEKNQTSQEKMQQLFMRFY